MQNRVDHLAAGVIGLCLVAAMLLASSGCKSTGWGDRFNLAKNIPWPTSREKRENPPERLASFWTDAVQTRPGGKPTRGFGGRIYLYDHEGGEPVEAEGQLVVYAFDEASRSPSDNRPTKRYVFPPEQFAKHASESEMGLSYSVWLPWDEAGGVQKKISLIARFEPKIGSTIIGRQSLQQLPGAPVFETAPTTNVPQLASYNGETNSRIGHAVWSGEQGAGDRGQGITQRMTTTSIALPPRAGKSIPHASVRNGIPEGSRDKAASRRPSSVETEAKVRSPYPVNSTALQSRLSGFRLDKRLAPEGRVSPPAAFRGP